MTSTAPGRELIGVVVAVALAWSTVPLCAELWSRHAGARATDRRPDRAPPGSGAAPHSITTLVRLGDEPDEVARASVLMMLEGGPTHVVIGGNRHVPAEIERATTVHRAPTVEEAVAAAARTLDSDAVLVVSARAVPSLERCRTAAAQLSEHVGWISGRTQAFSDEGFAPDHRQAVGRELRARGRYLGVDLWEPDATLVRTAVLREHPITPGRPWGEWLRDLRRSGLRGVGTDDVLAYRARPLDAASYWPDTILRQCATAADMAGATRSGPIRARAFAMLLLARELYALPLLGWLALPVMLGSSGEFPFDRSPLWSIGVVGALTALRWRCLRVALGVEHHARDDMVSALHHLPGSAAAVWSSITGSVRPMRASVPTRPLVWAALFLTVVAGSSLLDHEPGGPVSRVSMGTTLLALALLWAFMVRSLVQRGWRRRSHRTPLDLDVTIEGAAGRTVDGSPAGLAVTGPFDGLEIVEGRRLALTVQLEDGTRIAPGAVLAARRSRRGLPVLGLALEFDEGDRGPWLAQLFRSVDRGPGPAPASVADPVPTTVELTPTTWRSRITSGVDRAVRALVVLCSTAVVAVLLLAMLGFHPLVVRSPSMVPTLGIGDVVLSEQIRASEVRTGDIVTQPERRSAAEAVTHRVVSAQADGSQLRFETRGDANSTGEVWSAHPDELVGRHRWTIPWLGRIAMGVRTSGTQFALGALVMGALVVSIVHQRGSSHGGRPRGGWALARPPHDEAAAVRSPR